jgi:PAS domain S-box-containing protein
VRNFLVCYFASSALVFSPVPVQAGDVVLHLDQPLQMLEQHPEVKLIFGLLAGLIVVSLIGLAGWIWTYKRRQADRRKDNLTLKKTVHQLATAQRIGQMGYWRMHPGQRTFEFSDEVFEIFDFKDLSNPVPYDQILPLVHPDDRAETELYLERAPKTIEPIRFEFRLIPPNKKMYYISGESRLEIDEDNGTTSVFGIFRDVTDRKNSEIELRNSERKYRNLLDEALWGITIHRLGEIIYVNQALATMLAYDDPDDVVALGSVAQLIVPEDQAALSEYAARRLRGEAVPELYDAGFQCKHGQQIQVQIMAKMIDWDGEPAIQAMIVDVTGQRKAEEALRQSQKMDAIGQLTGGVAHDFNNLLSVIIGNLDMATDDLSHLSSTETGDAGIFIQRALASATKGAGLTGQLLAFARKQNPQHSMTSISEMLPDLHDMLARILPENIVLELMVDDKVSDITADANQLTNALLNLAINARDAMPQGGKLIFAARNIKREDIKDQCPENVSADHLVEISVCDTGVGMTAQTLAQAFEPFYTTKEMGAGTGLGLSMVFGFARQSGGFAAIESEPGVGTTIRIYVPTLSTIAEEIRQQIQE